MNKYHNIFHFVNTVGSSWYHRNLQAGYQNRYTILLTLLDDTGFHRSLFVPLCGFVLNFYKITIFKIYFESFKLVLGFRLDVLSRFCVFLILVFECVIVMLPNSA